MLKVIGPVVTALAVSLATAWINPPTDEWAMYGHEGSPRENWRPRDVAGWPAPFLADNPGTSVPHKVGIEDTFRLGPFIGTLSFWFLVISAAQALIRSAIRAGHRE
jgi:hypothetical protein